MLSVSQDDIILENPKNEVYLDSITSRVTSTIRLSSVRLSFKLSGVCVCVFSGGLFSNQTLSELLKVHTLSLSLSPPFIYMCFALVVEAGVRLEILFFTFKLSRDHHIHISILLSWRKTVCSAFDCEKSMCYKLLNASINPNPFQSNSKQN